MLDVLHLIEGLLAGDPEAGYVAAFTVVGTVLIVAVVAVVRRRRRGPVR